MKAPVLGASVALVRASQLLLVRRGQAPGQGLYAFPGGKIEYGEHLRDGALRELWEEVGMKAQLLTFIGHNEIILAGGEGQATSHHVVACYLGRWLEGEGTLSKEVSEMIWLAPDADAPAPLAPGMAAMLGQAFDLAARMKL